MTAFTFILISIIEYVGVIISMLALFRYPVSHYVPQIIFTSVICSFLSYALSVENDIALAPLIQLIVMAVCIWLMFNTPIIWSFVMCILYFVTYTLFQGGTIYFLFWLGCIPAVLPKTGSTIYTIQIFCSAFCMLLGYYWLRKRIGFLFIPTSKDERFSWSKSGVWLFVGSVISFIASGIVFEIYPKTQFNWFYVLLAILLIVSGSLLLIMKRKNKEYVEQPWPR